MNLYKKIIAFIACISLSFLTLFELYPNYYHRCFDNFCTSFSRLVWYLVPSCVPQEKLPALDFIPESICATGSQEMKKHKIVITGIARDNIMDMAVMIKNIEMIGEMFADYRVIIFENDSTDGTKEALNKWQLRNKNVHIIMKDYHIKKRLSIKFMADARNHYIEALKAPEYDAFDMVMMIDMDMTYGIDIRGIQDSFSKIERWDAVCSNGVYRNAGNMWDAFAFRNQEFPQKSSVKNYATEIVPKIQRVYQPNTNLVPVYSCFGGMAFYKRKVMQDCVYDSVNNDCEHVAFHQCLRTKHKAQIVMNPAQMIRYPKSIDVYK